MNWISESVSDLRLYGQRKRFLENVDSQLIWLEKAVRQIVKLLRVERVKVKIIC